MPSNRSPAAPSEIARSVGASRPPRGDRNRGCGDRLNEPRRPPVVDEVGSRLLYRFAKSRWEIENEGFNDGKTRYGMQHLRHHHADSVLVMWLLTILALTIERLYRLRYLHRGRHRPATPIEFLRMLRLSLGPSRPFDTG